MFIIPMHAKQKLKQHLTEIEECNKSAEYNALYLTLSWLNLDEESLRGLYLLIERKLEYEFGHTSGYCYIFNNADILILSSTLKAKELEQIGAFIQDICLEDEEQTSDELLYIKINPQTNWPTLIKLCDMTEEKDIPPIYMHPQQDVPVLNRLRQRRNTPLCLVVEDETSYRFQLASSLIGHAEVLECYDFQDALESYRLNLPDCVFLDAAMAQGTGLEFLSLLLTLDPEAYIIIVSSETDENIIHQAQSLGAKGYLTKPFMSEQISNYLQLYKDKKKCKH